MCQMQRLNMFLPSWPIYRVKHILHCHIHYHRSKREIWHSSHFHFNKIAFSTFFQGNSSTSDLFSTHDLLATYLSYVGNLQILSVQRQQLWQTHKVMTNILFCIPLFKIILHSFKVISLLPAPSSVLLYAPIKYLYNKIAFYDTHHEMIIAFHALAE